MAPLSIWTIILPVLGCLQSVEPQDSYPKPEPCLGYCSSVHDPSIIHRNDGTWFRFSTGGGIAIATAPDLIGPWRLRGSMLPQGSAIHIDPAQDIWAPDVSKIGNTYYAYYAVSLLGSQRSDIGVATSSSMDVGSWTDHGSIGIPPSSDYNRIDPNWFRRSARDIPYFNFGSAWNAIYQTVLDPTMLKVAPNAPITRLAYNSTPPADGPFPSITEGSFLFQWGYKNTGNLVNYLFLSNGACCNAPQHPAAQGEEYKIFVCRSDRAMGPYVDRDGRDCLTGNGGTLVLASHNNIYAPGGQGAWWEPGMKGPVLYYHYGKSRPTHMALYRLTSIVDTNIGRDGPAFQFGFNYMDFSSGWPVLTTFQ